jgi:AAA+ superfamily predicted ATPase
MPAPPIVLEHTLAHLDRLNLLLQYEVRRLRVSRGQREDEEYRGLYVSEDDVDQLTAEAPPRAVDDQEFDAAMAVANRHIAEVNAECQAAGETPRLQRLATLFDLSLPQTHVILIALAAEADVKYERVFAYLQDDVTKKRPTVDLVFRVLRTSARERLAARRWFEPDSPLLRWELIGIHDDPGARKPVLLSRFLKLDERIAGYLLGSDVVDARIGALPARTGGRQSSVLHEAVRCKISSWANGWRWSEAACAPVILVHGRYGTGHNVAAEALADSLGRPLLQLEASAPNTPDLPLTRRMLLAEREALLTDSVLAWSSADAVLHFEPGQDAEHRTFTRALAEGRTPTVLLAERSWEPGRSLSQRPFIRLELADTTYRERRDLWSAGLGEASDLSPDELSALAARFRLSAGQIGDAIARARTLAWAREPSNGHILAADIDAACRVQAQHRLGTLARKLEPRYGWDDIVLPLQQLTTLRLIAAMIRQRPVVYGEWGFDRKLAMGKGVIALFAGSSGTGKTMAAEILAHDLGLDLYRIDLSSVVNKYIGETEKNLERLFTEGQDSDAILFFDEADALFGKRSGVSDAHDRYANIETAYLLQRTEEYNGLVILASNLPKNMDDAFVRRVHFTVNFPTPEEPERLEIWRRGFPREAPRADDLDLEFLAHRLKITGGNIRNIVLAAAFLAAEDRQDISMRHLVRAAGYEYQKMGKMLLESDFGKYFELIRA